MFFGNSQLLERNLHNDLNTFIKNIRAREDQHLTLLQYNKGLIAQLLEMDSIPFLQEEISRHKTFFASFEQCHLKIKIEERQLLQKYDMVESGQQNIVKLMSRVTARALEICQSSLDKSKFLDSELYPKYQQLKNFLIQLPNDRVEVKKTLSIIIQYVQTKNIKQMDRLKEILDILIEGDFQKLNRIYGQQVPVKKEPLPKQQQQSPLIRDQKRILSRSKQKIPKIDNKIQAAERVRREKTKLVAKMLTNLYSTMEISKQHFNETMIFSNADEHRKKLYEDIMSRNKINQQHITKFQSQKEIFEKKVKKFKYLMQIQSKKIAQAIYVREKQVIEDKNIDGKKAVKKSQCKSQASERQENDIVMPEREKIFNFKRIDRRSRKIPSPRFIKNLISSSMNCTQEGFQHIKFDDKKEQIFGKNSGGKLPQIPVKPVLESRYEKYRQPKRGNSDLKDDKRKSIAKNIEISMANSSITKNSSLAYQSNRKSPRERSPGMLDNIQGGGFDFTFYSRKKGGKRFNETFSNNFIL